MALHNKAHSQEAPSIQTTTDEEIFKKTSTRQVRVQNKSNLEETEIMQKKKIAKTIIDNLCKIRKDITSMKQEQNAIEKEHLTEQKPFLEN